MASYRARVSIPGTGGFAIALTGPGEYKAETRARHISDVMPTARQRVADDLQVDPGSVGITITITMTSEGKAHGDVGTQDPDHAGP